jgi:hypothetical protein
LLARPAPIFSIAPTRLRRLTGVVNPKFEGWIEKLLVNTTGQAVRRGEPLLEPPALLNAVLRPSDVKPFDELRSRFRTTILTLRAASDDDPPG